MGWWPFGWQARTPAPVSARADHGNDPHMRSTRDWLLHLRDVCEHHFDEPEAGRLAVRDLQVEWRDADARQELIEGLAAGLDRRATFLLRAKDDEWARWLDDDDFWEPGWRPADGGV